ncbi:MAG: hypothetical protein ABW133_14270 [Polyangiaceae bacterium]
MNLRRSSVVGSLALVAVLSSAKASNANPPAPQGAPLALRSTPSWIRTSAPWPETLTYENRYYAVNMTGLRTYLESIRESAPQLYGQLDSKLSRLESRQTIATGVLVGGIAVSAVSFVYAFVPTRECVAPAPSDPNFAAAADAFDQCGRDRMTRMATFSLIGLGSLGAGLIGNWLISPSRSDVLGFISEHNQLNPTPLRLQVAFDPTRRSAFAGAQISF